MCPATVAVGHTAVNQSGGEPSRAYSLVDCSPQSTTTPRGPRSPQPAAWTLLPISRMKTQRDGTAPEHDLGHRISDVLEFFMIFIHSSSK